MGEKMQKIAINLNSKGHEMKLVKIIGDVAFLKCPICADYERTINLKTGKLTRNRDSRIAHYGLIN
jgi:hypothetical protein